MQSKRAISEQGRRETDSSNDQVINRRASSEQAPMNQSKIRSRVDDETDEEAEHQTGLKSRKVGKIEIENSGEQNSAPKITVAVSKRRGPNKQCRRPK